MDRQRDLALVLTESDRQIFGAVPVRALVVPVTIVACLVLPIGLVLEGRLSMATKFVLKLRRPADKRSG